MPESILKMLIVVGLVAVGTFIVILLADLVISLIGNKDKKNNKNAQDKNDSKNRNYIYDANAELADIDKFKNGDYLLDLDDDEDNEKNHYDEAQAEKEKALALKDKGNDINWFSELAGSNSDESDFEKMKRQKEENNTSSKETENENTQQNSKNTGSVNPFLFDDDDDDITIELNKDITDDNNKTIPKFNLDDDDDEEVDDDKDNTVEDENLNPTDNDFNQGEQQFKFEDENDTISPIPKSVDKNFDIPSDEELIDFINQRALDDYDLNKNSLNNLSNNASSLNFDDFDDNFDDDFNFNNTAVTNELEEKENMILKLQEELQKLKSENIKSNEVENATTEILPMNTNTFDKPENNVVETLNRDRIQAEVNKQMQINKLAEKEELYREEIKKIQASHKEEIERLQAQNKMLSDQFNQFNTSKLEMENSLKNQIELLNSSKQEMENSLKNQINLLNSSKEEMAKDFKKQLEEITSSNVENQNLFISEINSLKEQLQQSANTTPVIETPVTIEPEPIIEEIEEDVILPKKTDKRYEELNIKLSNLETRLKAIDKALKNNKKEYIPIIKAQKYINDNNDRFNRKSNSISKLKIQLSKPKYAEDKEKQAKYESELQIYEQLRIDMTRNKEYLDLNSSKIPMLEKENTNLTKQHTELSNQIEIIKTELKKYE